MTVVVVQHNKVIAAGVEGRLHDLEVNGRHLRADDRVFRPHLFRERYLFDGGGMERALLLQLFTHLDCGKQRTHADSCRAQVVYLVDF